MMVDSNNVMGLRDIAKLAGVTDGAVANWRRRHRLTFPQPIASISDGTPIFLREHVVAWLESTGRSKS